VPTFYAAVLRAAEAERVTLDFLQCGSAFSAGESLPAEILSAGKKVRARNLMESARRKMCHMFYFSPSGENASRGAAVFLAGSTRKLWMTRASCTTAEIEISGCAVEARSRILAIPELTARTKRGEMVVTGDKSCMNRMATTTIFLRRTTCESAGDVVSRWSGKRAAGTPHVAESQWWADGWRKA